jgi:hypothetical protein
LEQSGLTAAGESWIEHLGYLNPGNQVFPYPEMAEAFRLPLKT